MGREYFGTGGCRSTILELRAKYMYINFSPSHLFTFFTDLTGPFSSPLSLSSILTVPSQPLRIYSSFSSSQKKYSSFSSLFSLRSTEISREWKYSEKYNKKEQWKFLVIFPKRSTKISSPPNF